jgi:hypothetical protein
MAPTVGSITPPGHGRDCTQKTEKCELFHEGISRLKLKEFNVFPISADRGRFSLFFDHAKTRKRSVSGQNSHPASTERPRIAVELSSLIGKNTREPSENEQFLRSNIS